MRIPRRNYESPGFLRTPYEFYEKVPGCLPVASETHATLLPPWTVKKSPQEGCFGVVLGGHGRGRAAAPPPTTPEPLAPPRPPHSLPSRGDFSLIPVPIGWGTQDTDFNQGFAKGSFILFS